MAYISEFTTDVVHTPGTSNVVADLLSRPPPPPKTPPTPLGNIQVLGEPLAASTRPSAETPPITLGNFQVQENCAPASTQSAAATQPGFFQDAASAATHTATPLINHQEMALRQILCQDTQRLRGSATLQVISKAEGDLQLLGDISTGTFRIFYFYSSC